jgi:colanic acid biosynthesis glycosyl transferase WcaI
VQFPFLLTLWSFLLAKLRISITDYSGHPFQVQLSRELARRGHHVLHLYFGDFLTPKGLLTLGPHDPLTLSIETVSLDRPFAKNKLVQRYFQEIEIGRRIAKRVDVFRPDIAVGCNLPLDSLNQLSRSCRSNDVPFVFWQQDIYSEAISRILTKRFGFVGHLLGRHYQRLERRVLHTSSAVVVIADDFVDALFQIFGVPLGRAHVIENWAPLEELSPNAKDNPWARSQDLHRSPVVLYTGTLGLKHDASKLLAVAEGLRQASDATLVVASEGLSADWLAGEAKRRRLTNLRVLPFQPFEAYPEVLATADVLIGLLEVDAGVFSVPSKILSYLCSQRAIVLSAPTENLAARIINRTGAGVTVRPDDVERFVASILKLLGDPSARAEAGCKGRRYAEQTFAIGPIADRFESIFTDALKRSALQRPLIGGGAIISETAARADTNSD